jgi:hypothetical protein
VSSPDVEALEDDFVSLSMMHMEKELLIGVAGLFTLDDVWLCEQPSGFAAPYCR